MIDQGNDTSGAGEIFPDGMTMDDANARTMRYARKMNEKTAVGGEAAMMQRQAGSAREVSLLAAGSSPCARACGCA